MQNRKGLPIYLPPTRVSINTGNADGSIPSIPNYYGTVTGSNKDGTLVYVKADDGDFLEVHPLRLTKA